MDNCANCGAAYKSSVFGSNAAMNKRHIAFLNEYYILPDKQSSTYCEKCGRPLFDQAVSKLGDELKALKKVVKDTVTVISLLTIENPTDWEYKAIDMISAQSVTGTGVLSELSADFNDLFGGRSNTLSGKLKSGEDFCKAQLRLQAAELGCHAVLGIDIDYSEVGSLRGMMMVCMAGTAIRLKNIAVLGEQRANDITVFLETMSRIKYLTELQAKTY